MTSAPARRPGPKPGKGDRSRRRILAAAESVFADLGFHAASIVKITEAAGVAQGTFYIYFESKQAVFEEVLLDLNHRVRQAMAEGARDAGSREEAERGGFSGFFRFTAEHPALYRVIRQAEFVAPELLERHYATIATGYVDGLRQAMTAGEIAPADPEVVAWALMAVGEMIGMRWVLWPKAAEIPPAVFEETMGFVTRALGGGHGRSDR
ncbi:MAG TPA: TetR/AcrR family transcriptional regulator [Pseudonocardiaceae bacterium]|nr:TetR/AcrR family transcriptional regulator [Pseudonocardiaceae bacterium]